MSLFVSSSPFDRNKRRTSSIMLYVALALVPAIGVQTYFFGYGVLIQALLAMLLAVGFEAGVLKLRGRPIRRQLSDNSAIVTGLLLAVSIPPLSPWWILAIGLFFAIVVAKHLYGGLGQNLFNPAMVAYVVLLISFPVQMTSWLTPEQLTGVHLHFKDCLSVIFTGFDRDGSSLQQIRLGIDGLTSATPLDSFKTGVRLGNTPELITSQAPFSFLAGVGWEWVNLAYLAAGLILIRMRIIFWHIPVAMLASLAIFSLFFDLVLPGQTASPLIHLFSGATMLGAFFIATDPVTASTTVLGRLIYGAFIGLLVYIIRTWGGYPDGVAFAVLIANMTVPLIDYYTKPRAYGHKR